MSRRIKDRTEAAEVQGRWDAEEQPLVERRSSQDAAPKDNWH